jgi:hypothetical protein
VFLGDQFKGGEFDSTNGWVRFGPAHNDIVPRLGDVIRWKLGLTNRGSAEKARAKIGATTTTRVRPLADLLGPFVRPAAEPAAPTE